MPVLSDREMREVNHIIRSALFSGNVTERLLKHNDSLKDELRISEYVWGNLSDICATSLKDFCQQVK